MQEKDTNELEQELGRTHIDDYCEYALKNKDSMITDATSFSSYMKAIMRQRGISQQIAFLKADIPERYGYKLLSGEKHTRQRDVIIRICYASELTLKETQRALRKYGMPELYAKIPRDAMLMIAFNERPGSIIDVNSFLKENGMEPLRTSGVQE
jgi:hypothetical protein